MDYVLCAASFLSPVRAFKCVLLLKGRQVRLLDLLELFRVCLHQLRWRTKLPFQLDPSSGPQLFSRVQQRFLRSAQVEDVRVVGEIDSAPAHLMSDPVNGLPQEFADLVVVRGLKCPRSRLEVLKA